MIDENNYDLIVLDIMMPYVDGFEVLNYVRKVSKIWIPVIMLTAKSDEEDKITGLDIGADDYMVKPFSNRELEARIKANLRKYDNNQTIKTDLFEIDELKYIISRDEVSVIVTRKELDLIKYLIKNINNFVSKEEMLINIWGNLDTMDTRTVDIHISKIRRKLSKINPDAVITTKRGLGYGLCIDAK
jgi:two-component system response regulator VicR